MVSPARKTATSPQEPRRQRTHAALLAAGLDLLGSRPIEAVAVDEIVARAGVAKGSFFNHFADKQAFAAAVADAIRIRLEEEVTRTNEGIADPALRLTRGVCCAARFARGAPKEMQIMLRLHGGQMRPDHPLNEGLRNDIAGGLARGRFRGFDVNAATLYVIGISHMVVAAAARTRDRHQAAQDAAGVLALMLTGLGVADAHDIAARAAKAVIAGP